MPPKQRVSNSSLSSPTTPKTPGGTPAAAVEEPKKRSANEVLARVVTTLFMAYGFLGLIAAGVEYIAPVVLLIKAAMFFEIVRISQKERKERQLPSMRLLQWYFLAVTVVGAAAVALRNPLIAAFPRLQVWYNSLFIISFGLYVIGFVIFVLSLRRGYYRYQMAQFSWLAMTLVFITGQGSLQYANMLRGLFWFLLPISCVVHNDIWAYACGKNFGRTSLLRLSPKKTVEGFVGAWIMTTIWAFWFSGYMCRFKGLVCPTVKMFERADCIPEAMFVAVPHMLPREVAAVTGVDALNIAPVQLHALVFAAFASLIAPFGGFFASGLKRAFKLKDFGDLIPGHGGMTDRMDCQIIMGAFTYVYVQFVYAAETGTCPLVPQLVDCLRNLPPETRQLVLSEATKA
uniref:Phosphatidate cytidylyltransferase n=1 Tax=Neobodo designis TaxID=312471 RepID=A0A7S1W0X6_NEODS